MSFRGRGYEHAVDLAGLGRLTGVFAETCTARGEEVKLRLDPAGCHVFATPAADAALPPAPPRDPGKVGSVNRP